MAADGFCTKQWIVSILIMYIIITTRIYWCGYEWNCIKHCVYLTYNANCKYKPMVSCSCFMQGHLGLGLHWPEEIYWEWDSGERWSDDFNTSLLTEWPAGENRKQWSGMNSTPFFRLTKLMIVVRIGEGEVTWSGNFSTGLQTNLVIIIIYTVGLHFTQIQNHCYSTQKSDVYLHKNNK